MTTLDRDVPPSATTSNDASGPIPLRATSRPVWFEVLNPLLTPLVFLAVLFALGGGTAYLLGLLVGEEPWVRPMLTVTIGLLFSVAMCAVVWLACRVWAKIPFRRVGLVWTKHSMLAIGVGLMIAFVAELVASLLAMPLGLSRAVTDADIKDGSLVYMIVGGVAASVLVQGFPEELVFRGYLMNSSFKHRPAVAVLLSVVVFGSIHLLSAGGQQNLGERFLYLLTPLSFAFAGATSALWLRSLWSAVAVHAGMHLATKFFVPLITGQTWNSVAGMVLDSIGYTLAGIVCWVLYRRSGRREVVFDR